MIEYATISVSNVIQEGIARLGKHRDEINLGWESLISMVNAAEREIELLTLPYKEWSYIAKMYIGDGMAVPQNFIKHIRVMLQIDADGSYREGRYVDIKELFTLSDDNLKNKFLAASQLNPIFTFWGNEPANNTTDETLYTIYIKPDTMTGYMEYYYTPDFQNGSDVIYIPYEFEELLVLSFVTRLLVKLQDYTLLVRYNQDLMQERLKVIEFVQQKKHTRQRELDSFVDMVLPYVSPQPEPNEANVEKTE